MSGRVTFLKQLGSEHRDFWWESPFFWIAWFSYYYSDLCDFHFLAIYEKFVECKSQIISILTKDFRPRIELLTHFNVNFKNQICMIRFSIIIKANARWIFIFNIKELRRYMVYIHEGPFQYKRNRYILIRFISNIKELHIHQFRMTLKFSFLYCEHCSVECSPCSKTGN